MKCQYCNCEETYIKEKEHNYKFKGKNVEFNANRRFCKNCNQLVYDEELDNIASLKAIEIFNTKYGITKEKIINLRKSFNLSQELFAKVIGCAKKTLISYELGKSIPNDTYMIILNTLLENPNYILLILDANKDLFTKSQYEKILSKIDLNGIETCSPSIYNGFTKMNKEKIKNLILILTKKGMQKTKLLKEMFYIDFLCFKNTSSSLTGLTYAKLNYGPVPDNYEKIIEIFEKEKVIKYEIRYQNNYECHDITAIKDEDKTIFDKEELEIINTVISYFEKYNSKEIAEYSHKEKAFTETEFYKKIDYDYAYDIELNS